METVINFVIELIQNILIIIIMLTLVFINRDRRSLSIILLFSVIYTFIYIVLLLVFRQHVNMICFFDHKPGFFDCLLK